MPEKVYLLPIIAFAVALLVSLGFAIKDRFHSPILRIAVCFSAIALAICIGVYMLGK